MTSGAVIKFDAKRHLYFVRGRQYPSVSGIIKSELGIYYPPRKDDAAEPEYVLRGNRVHILTENDDAGKPCNPKNSDDVPFLNAWRDWRAQFGGYVDAIEMRVSSDVYRYAGTLDRIIRRHEDPRYIAIVDLKTGKPAPWHRLQTAGYAQAYVEDGHAGIGADVRAIKRIAVYLRPDGTWREAVHANPEDIDAWRAACCLHHWKQANR